MSEHAGRFRLVCDCNGKRAANHGAHRHNATDIRPLPGDRPEWCVLVSFVQNRCCCERCGMTVNYYFDHFKSVVRTVLGSGLLPKDDRDRTLISLQVLQAGLDRLTF